MRKTTAKPLQLFIVIACLLFTAGISFAQQRNQYASDAFLITRMVEKFHVQPRAFDTEFSERFFNRFFKEADEDRFIFIATDMAQLNSYRYKLADEVHNRQYNFLNLVTGIYEQRIHQLDSLLQQMMQQVVNFTIDEKLTVAEDTSYAANTQMKKQKLGKLVKRMMLAYIINHADLTSATPLARQKKVTDSLEPAARKKTITSLQRGLHSIVQGAKSIPALMGNIYCESLAESFDPHTSYLPKTEKENFESSIGQKSMQFGFTLEQEDEGVIIHELKPGSAAYRSGLINKGDKVVGVQWNEKQSIDVGEADIEEISAMLDESNYGKMTLTVKKADGQLRKVELQKESLETDGENKVKSFLLRKGDQFTGYISLPAFYTDWDEQQNNSKGCANDIAKEILRLKKENITGLIIDLRYNGGGSMQEAVELSGIFIDAGPVAQISSMGGKVYTLKDINRGTIYDGPLLVLVNGSSASASEMFAGTMQDYHRAVIIGTPTYGKATAQVIMPLDTLAKPGVMDALPTTETFLKITIEKLYRITGATAQREGVIPDVLLPDLSEGIASREVNEPSALTAPKIEANRFYTPYAGAGIEPFVTRGRALTDTSVYYNNIKRNAALVKELTLKSKADIPLRLQEALQLKEKNDATEKCIDMAMDELPVLFTIQNPASEEEKLKLLPDQKEMNEQWKTALQKDRWIQTAFQVLTIKK